MEDKGVRGWLERWLFGRQPVLHTYSNQLQNLLSYLPLSIYYPTYIIPHILHTLIMWNRVLIIILSLSLAASITLPINNQRERCMIVYSNHVEEHLKLDLKFTRFPGQTERQGYRLRIINTESWEEQAYQIIDGSFKREFPLDQNIIYRVCIMVASLRLDRVNSTVEYQASTRHTKHNIQAKVPEHLAKSQDLKRLYNAALTLNNTIAQESEILQKRLEGSNQTHAERIASINAVSTMAIIQIGLIVIAGLYQLLAIRSFLKAKGYV